MLCVSKFCCFELICASDDKQTGTSELLWEDGDLSMGISLMHNIISVEWFYILEIKTFANDAVKMHVLAEIIMMIYAIVTTSEANSLFSVWKSDFSLLVWNICGS